MARTKIAQETTAVTVGVDTHRDIHVARAKDHLGRLLGEKQVETTTAGYRELLSWAKGLGEIEAFGIEGTGSYGAGLARFLADRDIIVFEVIRPNRARRRRNGKSDPTDADAAASAVLSKEALCIPKSADGKVEMIRCLRIARASAVKAHTQAINAMKALVTTAPQELRESLPRPARQARALIKACASLEAGSLDSPSGACRLALCSLAKRCISLEEEITALGASLSELVQEAAPELVSRCGIGTDSAGALLVAVGDNPDRLRSDAALSKMCGVSPLEASSGQIRRHRLNRGGNREANAALYRIVLVRLRWHQPTIDYLERRTKEGLSKREIIRCLKRFVAREVYQILCCTQENPVPLVT